MAAHEEHRVLFVRGDVVMHRIRERTTSDGAVVVIINCHGTGTRANPQYVVQVLDCPRNRLLWARRIGGYHCREVGKVFQPRQSRLRPIGPEEMRMLGVCPNLALIAADPATRAVTRPVYAPQTRYKFPLYAIVHFTVRRRACALVQVLERFGAEYEPVYRVRVLEIEGRPPTSAHGQVLSLTEDLYVGQSELSRIKRARIFHTRLSDESDE
jgi:hypothetical protein